MSKWIVFITVVHEEMTFTADLRAEGERSVATYPLLAAPTNTLAELVVARLNHQHGLPEEAGTDDWQEFSFKAETELTPQEVAMVLDLNDPAYPKNGRHPSWLLEMVTAAKTAMAEVVKHVAQNGTASERSARSPTLHRVNDLLRAVERVVDFGAVLRGF